ncbi:MAG: type I pantothenate kinase [Dysgonomonas sp.]
MKVTPPPSPYMLFDREQWASLRNSEPMTLTEEEFEKLQGIEEKLSINEVTDIYLPLSRLLKFYVDASFTRQRALSSFLGRKQEKIPYIISIAGSVAAGKSTTARILQTLLSRWTEHKKVSLITTDGFLYPNAELEKRCIMNRKGFPESYDIGKLLNFVSDIKSGEPNVEAPVYSHLIYDIVPDKVEIIESPDILILEGLNVLQTSLDYPENPNRVFVSDFVDFSIYVDVNEPLLEYWYIKRFFKLRESAFSDPNSYFKEYAKLSNREAIRTAHSIWVTINKKNLMENILPTRERASLILSKGANHAVDYVRLRK